MRVAQVAAVVLISAASPVIAQSADRRFWAQGMVFRPAIDTSVRVGATNLGDAEPGIDFEQALGFPQRETLPSVTLGARFGRNWRVTGDFYRLDRRRSAVLDRELVFDGVTFPVDGKVDARFGSDIYRATVGYSFISRRRFEAGTSLGAHVTSFVVALAGDGQVDNRPVGLEARRRRVLAPLPTLGLYAEWRPRPRWLLATRADALSLKIGDYKGGLLNLQASASYEVAHNFALGASWRHVRYRLDVDRTDWSGRLRYRFDGPAAFVEWHFGAR